MTLHSKVKRGLTAFSLFAIALVLFASPLEAFAETQLQFKNGKVWRGDDGAIVQVEFKNFRTGKKQELTGTILEITKGKPGRRAITLMTTAAGRDAKEIILEGDIIEMTTVGQSSEAASGGDDAATTGKTRSSGGVATAATGDGVPSDEPGVFYLRWTGMVGTYARHDEMEMVAEEADKYGDNQIIVIHIESGGGMVTEGDKIHETLTELKKRHRVVAWVEKAISAAAYTAMHANEIYWHDEGTMGAIVMFNSGTGVSISGRRLDAWVKRCGDAAEESNLNRSIAEAMITRGEVCSYTKDPETGKVTVFDDLSGEVDLCDASDVLTLNKIQARDVGYCMGVANTKEELAKHLGLPEWREHPFGEKVYDRHQRKIDRAKEQVPRIMQDLQLSSTPQEQLRHMKRLLAHYEACGDIIMIVECRSPFGPKDELLRQMDAIRKSIANRR